MVILENGFLSLQIGSFLQIPQVRSMPKDAHFGFEVQVLNIFPARSEDDRQVVRRKSLAHRVLGGGRFLGTKRLDQDGEEWLYHR